MNGLTIPQLAARETTESDANNNPPADTRITDDSPEPLTANNSLESLTANDSLEPRAENHSPEPACFSLAALLVELRPYTELDQRTPAYHLQQSDATAADGYHHAAINEARSFLESLTVTIVREVRRAAEGRSETACEPPSSNTTAYRAHRRFLMESGFLDADENELVRYAYSLASAKGSHHGIADEAWACLTHRVVHAARASPFRIESRLTAASHRGQSKDH